MSKIINLFGGPGIGKSTQASGLYFEMKKLGMSVEMPYEYPKVLAWDKNYNAVKDQLYVIGNQHRNIARLYGQVDYIIVDSPILLSLVYKDRYNDEPEYPSSLYGNKFNEFILDLNSKYDSLNIVLERDSDMFNQDGRFQDLDESVEIDNDIVEILDSNNINYNRVKVNNNSIKTILSLLTIS
jgi:hypothetical protein